LVAFLSGDSIFVWLGLLAGVVYGVFMVGWPESARAQFLAYYDLNAPMEWTKPRTWMTSQPPALAFRIAGIVVICVCLAILYVWLNRR